MTTLAQIAQTEESVKQLLTPILEMHLSKLVNDPTITPRQLEERVWSMLIELGRELLTCLLTLACWRVTARETEGETPRLRLDDDYVLQQSTTLGTVRVPLFAYRGASGTQAPARAEIFPLHPHCRSSELCLEWESMLGSNLPFRQAEDAIAFFSHGAVRIEDTTIARHIGVIGPLVQQRWTCRSPEEVARILQERATKDAATKRPLLYISSDAHALRRYVDNSWDAPWKMLNGIRLWCVDAKDGRIIHLGGAYTWGDCREVGSQMRALVEALVPVGDGEPQVVFIADGMPWFRDHIIPVLPADTCIILDFYHVMERLGDYAAARFGKATKEAKIWLARVKKDLHGKRNYLHKKQTIRKGHKKSRKGSRRRKRTIHSSEYHLGAGEKLLRDLIFDEPESDAFTELVKYLVENTDRMDYPAYRSRGMQVGSGAMESLHRVASQMRLKLAGARWTAERAQAVLNLRLMRLAERWDAFWAHPERTSTLATAFAMSSGRAT